MDPCSLNSNFSISLNSNLSFSLSIATSLSLLLSHNSNLSLSIATSLSPFLSIPTSPPLSLFLNSTSSGWIFHCLLSIVFLVPLVCEQNGLNMRYYTICFFGSAVLWIRFTTDWNCGYIWGGNPVLLAVVGYISLFSTIKNSFVLRSCYAYFL